jgi:hypothetical protein
MQRSGIRGLSSISDIWFVNELIELLQEVLGLDKVMTPCHGQPDPGARRCALGVDEAMMYLCHVTVFKTFN